jgi:small conductance mechanosensitive channel
MELSMATLEILIQNVVIALLVLAVAWVATGWIERLLEKAFLTTRLDPLLRRIALRVIRPLGMSLAAMSALERLGVSVTSFVAVTAVAAFAAPLAFRDVLSNAAAGAWLATLRPFNEGDHVQLGGVSGTIRETGLIGSVIETADGALVTIPNGLIASSPIWNHTRKGARRVLASLAVPWSANVPALLEALTALAAADPDVQKSPAPVSEVVTASDGLRLDLYAWVPSDRFDETTARLHLGIVRLNQPSKA